MAITLRSDRELKGSKKAEKKQTNDESEKAYQNSTSNENQQLKDQGEVAKDETV